MKTTTKKPVLRWTGYADDQAIRDYMDSRNEYQEDKLTFEQAQEAIYEDTDYWDREWDFFCEELTDLMNGREYWRDDASRIGWLSRTGYKVFKAENAMELIRAISPDTDCSYTITPYYKGFKVRLSHHDAPTGEYHVIRSISEEAYEKEEA